MNNKLLELVDKLFSKEEFKDLRVSLTLDYIELIRYQKYDIFNTDGVKRIKEIINSKENKSFNLYLNSTRYQ